MSLLLQTARLLLRPAREEDAAPLCAILAAPEVSRFWPGYDEARVRAEIIAPEDHEATILVIEEAGRPVGMIQFYEDLDPQFRHAGIDLFVGAPDQGRGLGQEAVRAVVEHLIGTLRYHRIVIDPARDNARALHAFEQVGFRPVGVLRRHSRGEDGAWHDGVLLELLAEDYRPPSPPPPPPLPAPVRLAGEGDLPALLSMMEAFNQLEQIPWTRERGEAPLVHLLAHRDLGLVGLFPDEGGEGGPLGYFVLTFGYDLEWDGRDAFLTEIFLCEGQRGRGLGRRALLAVEGLAREHGARALHLMVRDDNAPAMRLYRGAGYRSPQRQFLSKVLGPRSS